MEKKFLLLVFLLYTNLCFTQQIYNIKGRVFAFEKESKIEYEIKASSLGDIPLKQVNKKFQEKDFLLQVDFMPVLMEIAAVGYQDTIFIINSMNEQIDIHLNKNDVNLTEVVVQYLLPSFTNEYGRMEIQVSNTALSEAGSAADILQKAPKVKIDDTYGVFVGIDVATVYVNGREISDQKILTLLSSRDVEKVDIITNPSAKYDSQSKVIIEITTKARSFNSWSADITGHIRKGEYWRKYLQAELNGGGSKYSIYGSFTTSPEDLLYKESYAREMTINANNIYAVTDLNSKFNTKKNNDYKLGGLSKITKEHGLAFEAKLQTRDVSREGNNNTEFYSLPDKDFIGEIPTSSQSQYELTNLESFVSHTYKNEKGYSQKTIVDVSRYVYSSGNAVDEHSRSEKDFLSIRTDASFFLINHSKLDVGAKFQYRYNRNNFDHYNDTLSFIENRYRYYDKTGALYALLNLLLVENFNITIGGRIEYIRNKANTYSQITGETMFRNNQTCWNLIPNIALNYKGNKYWNLDMSYSQNVIRPLFADLNPEIDNIDPYFYRTGNPELKVERRHNLEMRAEYRKLSLNFSYVSRNDAIVWIMEQDKDDLSKTRSTQDNINRASMYSLDAVIPFLFNNFNFFLATGVIHSEAEDEKRALSLGQTLWYISHNLNLNLPYDIKLNLNYRYFTKGLMNVFYFKPLYRMDMSLKKTFSKERLTVVFMWNDIFKTDKMKTYTTMNNRSIAYRYSYDQSVVSLSLNYKMNLSR